MGNPIHSWNHAIGPIITSGLLFSWNYRSTLRLGLGNYISQHESVERRVNKFNFAIPVMMSETKIDLSSDSKKSSVNDASHVQYIPCSINHDGEVKLSTYFNPYVEKTTDPEGKTELSATFRGVPFAGEEMKLPEGYTGLVLRGTNSMVDTASSSEDHDSDVTSRAAATTKTLKVANKFDQFTYWNWDRKPSYADKYQQALNWIEISNVIHGTG